MPKNYIKPSEIQEGDLIKVKLTYKCGTVMTRKGVAVSNVNGAARTSWKDADGHYLFGTTEAESYTIELLDRPKPPVSVPNKPGAVVTYKRGSAYGADARTAVRESSGKWNIYRSSDGDYRDTRHSDRAFEDMFNGTTYAASDLVVIFPGVGA